MVFERSEELISDAEDWIEGCDEDIRFRYKQFDEEPKEEHQSTYVALALSYLDLGISRFLYGKSMEEAKTAFLKSAECIETSFVMAYDEASPLWLDYKANLGWVSMTIALDGIHAALVAGNFETAARIAKWTRIPANELPDAADQKNADILETNYSHGLKYLVLEDQNKARKYCDSTIEFFSTRNQNTPYLKNFYYRCMMVMAILDNNREEFNNALQNRLRSHINRGKGNGDLADTPKAEIYIDGIALCNLALKNGLDPTLTDPKYTRYIPKELLIKP